MIRNARLRSLACQALYLSKVEEAIEAVWPFADLKPLHPDDPDYYDEAEIDEGLPQWQLDHLDIVSNVLEAEADLYNEILEMESEEWLAGHSNHWLQFERLVFDPWQTAPGCCDPEAPQWVQRLGRIKAIGSFGKVRFADPPARRFHLISSESRFGVN